MELLNEKQLTISIYHQKNIIKLTTGYRKINYDLIKIYFQNLALH